jgi:membrane associated rhomboid family serine protease
MRGRVNISILLLIWLVIGVIVAINKGYTETVDNASHVATFILAVVLWPIPALDGAVAITF